MALLSGKKTYIMAGLAALTALVNFVLGGDFSLAAVMSFINSEALAGAFAALRLGVAGAPKT